MLSKSLSVLPLKQHVDCLVRQHDRSCRTKTEGTAHFSMPTNFLKERHIGSLTSFIKSNQYNGRSYVLDFHPF